MPSNHPTYAAMVEEAIRALNDRNGSSIPAIKKYILANYQVEPDKFHMKKGMQTALAAGSVTQVKGQGMNGSFKLGGAAVKPKAGQKRKAASPKKAEPAAASARKAAAVKKAPPKVKVSKPAKRPASPKAPKRKAPAKTKAAGSKKA